ncbi:MAG: 50S ribosomal protein L25 [Candidatus Niameybacter stercoravium]|nr:50S ribosomal protein L25 [Candidatus Niameybacter stercoravium]
MSQKVFTIMPRDSKKNLTELRSKGMIPGIMYGQSLTHSVPIQIALPMLQNIISDTTTMIFKLDLGGQIYDCVLRDFQTDRLHTEILHVDFQFVKAGEVIKMQIPMSFEGTEILRSKKYILEKAVTKIPVKGPVDVLPETFVVDTSNLEQGAKIFVSDLELPDKIEMLLHPDTIVATIH